MEAQWVSQRAHLRHLLSLHSEWTTRQLADAVGCSPSMVSKWRWRFAAADPSDVSVLFSRSRAPHHHPPRIDEGVQERIRQIRQEPPEGLQRTPGPVAILYYLQHDEVARATGKRLPRSTRTIWRVLDAAGLIERDPLRKHAALEPLEPLEEVQHPNVLPPRHPELNCYVERLHRTYKEECLLIHRPTTLEETRTVTEDFQQHYNEQRPHQGRSCGNRPPRQAFPVLSQLPSLPAWVDPDAWLQTIHGRTYARRVKSDGYVSVDGRNYYVKQALVGQQILLRVNAAERCLEVLQREDLIKVLPIKGLQGKPMPLEDFIALMQERARSHERQRLRALHQRLLQAR